MTTTVAEPSNGNATLLHAGSTRTLGAVLGCICVLLYAISDGVIFNLMCYAPLAILAAKVIKPRTAAEHAANLVFAIIWSVHSIAAIKILSLGVAPLRFGCLLPFLSLGYLLQRAKDPEKSHVHSRFSRKIVELFFDPPLVTSALAAKYLGVHIFNDSRGNFLTVVDEDLVMSSMPASSDVAQMQTAAVGAVVNMQGEWAGPVSAYACAGIDQLRLPTTDMECPTLADLERGVAWMEAQRRRRPGRRVLVHCKGGRGRATTMALAYYVKKGVDPAVAFERLRRVRPVVEPIVLTYPALIQFHANCKKAKRG